MKTFTRDEAKALIDADVWETVNRWLIRGDGIAIYENRELGHPEAGNQKLVSFGSPRCQLEVSEPPDKLPDIGNQLNWRYLLVGTYRGEILDNH